MGSTVDGGNTPKIPVRTSGTTSVASTKDVLYAKGTVGAATSTTVGGAQLSANIAGPSISITGAAKAHVGLDGVDVKVNASIDANLVSAGADGKKTFSVDVGGQKLDVTLDLRASGAVGANGQIGLDIHIGTDGKLNISAGVEGFAGARASLSGSITVASGGKTLASGTATLSAYAGATAAAGFHAGFDHGDLKFEAKAHAAVGVGLGLDIRGDVNIVNTAEVGAKMAGGLAEEGVEAVGHGFQEAGNWISNHIPHPSWP